MGKLIILIRLICHRIIVIPVNCLGFHLHLAAQDFTFHLEDRLLLKVSICFHRFLAVRNRILLSVLARIHNLPVHHQPIQFIMFIRLPGQIHILIPPHICILTGESSSLCVQDYGKLRNLRIININLMVILKIRESIFGRIFQNILLLAIHQNLSQLIVFFRFIVNREIRPLIQNLLALRHSSILHISSDTEGSRYLRRVKCHPVRILQHTADQELSRAYLTNGFRLHIGVPALQLKTIRPGQTPLCQRINLKSVCLVCPFHKRYTDGIIS